MKIKIILVLIISCLLSASVVSAEDNNSTNDVVAVTTDDGTFTALQQKIDNASSGDTIYLENDYGQEGTSGININKDLTIDGKGHTIDAKGKSRIFLVSSGKSVTLKNINFINGNDNGTTRGGGAISTGSGITVINSTFTNIAASFRGGAIYTHNGVVNAINSTFTNISAGDSGGAIYTHDGVVNAINSTFTNISAGDSGGAIHGYDGANIINSSFTNTMANSFGGVIYSSGSLYVVNSSFTNTTAQGRGGAIYNFQDANVINSSFTNTTAQSGSGGAIAINGGSVTVTNSSFINTKANDTGGAIDGNNGVNVINSNFINIRSEDSGGAISGQDVIVDNTTFKNTTALDNGGAIIYYISATVIDSKFEDCKATNGSDIYSKWGTVKLMGNDYDGKTTYNITDVYTLYGNIIEVMPGTFAEVQLRIETTLPNGVLNLENKKYAADETDETINVNENIIINGNGAILDAANRFRIMNIANGVSVTLKNINFINGNATGSGSDGFGGAIYSNNEITVYNSSFINITAEEGGGAIYGYKGNVTVINSSFTNIKSGISGGAIYSSDSLYVVNSCFNNNSAEGGGASISSMAAVYVKDSTFNSPNANGKAIIYIACGYIFPINLTNNTIESNLLAIYNYVGYIGGIFQSPTTLTFNNVTVEKGENATLTATLTDDKGNIIGSNVNVIGKVDYKDVTFVFNETTRNFTTLYNEPTDKGKYPITGNYAKATKCNVINGTLTVESGIPIEQFNIDIASKVYGNFSGTINILPANATGNVSINVNGTKYSHVNLFGGKADWLLTNVTPGNYNVTFEYSGDDNYNPAINSTIVDIGKASILPDDININVTNSTYGEVTVEVNLPSEVSGNVTITTDSDTFNANITDGKAVFQIGDKIATGEHNITITYNGDKKYNSASKNVTIIVDKIKTSMIIDNVTVHVGEPIVVIANTTGFKNNTSLIVFVSTNFIGTYLKNVTIIDDQFVLFNKTENDAGVIKYTVTFSGDDIYESCEAKFTQTVLKNETSISTSNIEGWVDEGNITVMVNTTGFANNTNITIGFGLVGSNVTIERNVTVINDTFKLFYNPTILGAGTFNFLVKFNGNGAYEPCNTTFIATINKHPTSMSIDNITLIFDQLPAFITINVTGFANNININLTIADGKESVTGEATVIDGKIIIGREMLIPVGVYNYTVSFEGNDIYLPCEANFTETILKGKINPENITINPICSVYGNETFIVNVPEIATGNITITIKGNYYTMPIVNGSALFEFGKNIAGGIHNVTVTYSGDDNYNSTVKNDNITVYKASIDPENDMDVNVTDSTYGEVIVEVSLSADVTGNVTITTKDGDAFDANLTDGKAVFQLGDSLTVGEHRITVIYNGDKNYNGVSRNDTITVDKINTTISIDGFEVYAEDGPVNITVTTTGFANNSNIALVVSESGGTWSDVYNVTVIDNKSTVLAYPSMFGAGNWTFDVIFAGNDVYNPCNTTFTVTVNKRPTSMSMDNIISIFDEVPVIAIINTTGFANNTKINITISDIEENETVEATVIDGKIIIEREMLIPVGVYNYTVSFEGNDIYLPCEANFTETILKGKINPENITINPISPVYGNETFIVNVPEIATGNISITINSKDYTMPIVNGSALFELGKNITGGTHNVTVTYSGDENYNSTVKNDNITVYKASIDPENDMDVNVTDSTYGEVIVEVSLPADVTGNVTITTNDGDTFDANLTNGKAVFQIGDKIATGEYNITVIYNGDKNYDRISRNATIAVDKIKTSMVIDNVTAHVGEPIVVIANTTGFKNNTSLIVFISTNLIGTYLKNVTIIDNQFVLFNKTENDAGVINYTVTFGGDDIYESCEAKFTQTILKNETSMSTINVEGWVDEGNITVMVNTTGFANNTNITIGFGLVGSNVTIERNVTVINDKFKLFYNPTILGAGTFNFLIEFNGNGAYEPCNTTFIATINKHPTSMSIDSITLIFDQLPAFITINTTGFANNTKINITISDIEENETVEATVIDGKIIIEREMLIPVGVYNYTVSFEGNDIYLPCEANFTETILKGKINPENITINSISPVYGNETFIVNVPEIATGNISITINGKDYTMPIVNGSALFELGKNIIAGTHNVTVTYSGDENYNSTVKNDYIAVKEATISPDDVTIEPLDSTYGNTTIEITLPDDATGNATLIADGKDFTVNVTDGKAIFQLGNNLIAGEHNFTVTYNGDNNYKPVSKNGNITVEKGTIEPSNAIKVNVTSDNITVVADLPSDAKGNLTVTINGKKYNIPLVNGKGKVTIPVTSGTYNLLVNYTGDSNYYGFVNTIPIIVPESILFTALSITLYYKNGTQFIVSFKYSNGTGIANQKVGITVHGLSYNRTTDGEGNAKLAINLASGKYPVYAEVIDSPYGKYNATANITVLSTIKGDNIVLYYCNGTEYTALFVDGKGNPLKNTQVSFNINGVIYARTTDENGISSGLTINLNPGTYIITATNPVNGEMHSNNITVLPTIQSSNLVKYYRNGSQFIVKLLDGHGNPVSGKTVTFSINGVFYTKTSDANGNAKLNINLLPAEYIITCEYEGCKVSNTVRVLSTIKSEDIEMTVSSRIPFVVTALDAHGNPASGKDLSFNINGVMYNRVTDANGNAKLNINLMAGEYIITTEYEGLMQSNTIIIRG